MGRHAPRCPECHGDSTVRIVYGLPDADLIESAERGDVAIGGCCITDDDPCWHCNGCGADFGRSSRTAHRTD